MRIQLWFAAIIGALVLSTGAQTSHAQMPPGPQAWAPNARGVHPASYNAGLAYPYPPPMTSPYAGGSPSDAFSVGPPPSGMLPYPGVNGPDYQANIFKDGLWQSESRSGRRMNLTLEFLFTRTRKPTGVFGNDQAQTYFETIEDALEELDDIDDDVLDLLRTDDQLGLAAPNFFDRVDFADEFGDINSIGGRVNFEIINPDESGVLMSFLYSADPTEQFNARKDVHPSRGQDFELLNFVLNNPAGFLVDLSPLDVFEVLGNNLLNLRGIPLDDGTLQTFDGDTTIGGVTSPYDLQFLLEIKTETYSGNIGWMMAPVYKTDYFKLRPVVGLRAMYMGEEIDFFGLDSGLVYDNNDGTGTGDPFIADVKLHSTPNGIDDDGDGIIDNAGGIEDDPMGAGGGGGGTQTTDSRFINFRIQDPNLPPIETTLNNRVRSYLLGPEVGVRYDFGGDKFVFSGMTKVGLMANSERISLAGNNFAMTTRDNNFIPSTPGNNQPNTFNDTESHTHVSPLIETSIYVDAPIFNYVPILRRFKVFSEANFRAGYTFTYIDHIARPYQSVNYQGNPAQGLFPTISVDRHHWTIGSYSVGVNWNW